MWVVLQLNKARNFPETDGWVAASHFQQIFQDDLRVIFLLSPKKKFTEFLNSLAQNVVDIYILLFVETMCCKISYSQVIRMRAQHYDMFSTYDF